VNPNDDDVELAHDLSGHMGFGPFERALKLGEFSGEVGAE
jgi:hypothetical protein